MRLGTCRVTQGGHDFGPVVSEEASKLAARLAVGLLESCMTGNRADPEHDIAVELQKLMDGRDTHVDHLLARAQAAERGEAAYVRLCDAMKARAEAAEARCVLLGSGSRAVQEKRAEAAESDAALAWQRVTELQARGTEIELERRTAEAKLGLFVQQVRAYREQRGGIDVRLDAILVDCEAKS